MFALLVMATGDNGPLDVNGWVPHALAHSSNLLFSPWLDGSIRNTCVDLWR